MASTRKTPYYNLSQFDDHDKPTWRGDYNGDMGKIDTGMQEIKTSAIDAKTAAQNAESSINEVKRDYLTKTDAQNTYATKTELNDTKTTIENNADNKFVAKTVYDTAIANKADKTSVYTKTESDGRFQPKTKRRKIVVIGDSYMTGYQPSTTALPESQRIPQIMAALLDADVHVFAANAAGYAKAGDGGKTFATLAEEAKTALGDAAGDVTDVLVCGGRNDDISVTVSQIGLTLQKLVETFDNSDVWVAFLWDNNSVSNEASSVIEKIRDAVNPTAPWTTGRNVRILVNAPFYGMTFTDCFADNGSDIHPNAKGSRRYGKFLAGALGGAGDTVFNRGSNTMSASGVTGTIQWRIYGGVLSLTAKFSCSSAVESGTQLAQLPKCFNLGDGFITAIMGLSGGDKIAFLRLTQGNLEYIGAAGGGDMSGTVWITPQSWTPCGNLS